MSIVAVATLAVARKRKHIMKLYNLKQNKNSIIKPLFRRYIAVVTGFVLIITTSSSYALKGKRIDAVRVKAKAGDALAQLDLGNQYFFGNKRRTRNYTVAALWYRRSAMQGNAAAQFNLAICYDRALGVKKSRFHAFRWYKKAAAAGVKQAKLNLALCYAYGIPPDRKAKEPTPPIYPNFAKAKTLLLELGQQGFFPALRELGGLYLEQKSADDHKLAVQLLNKAAAANDFPAMRLLADCYQSGLGCEKDSEKMIYWLRKAVAGGDIEAVAKLGFCYEYGDGVKPDSKKAFELFKKSADNGLAMAQTKMGEYYADGKFVKQDIKVAIEWFELAAEQDNPYAIFKLGVFNFEGIGMKKNPRRGTKYFLAAARKGNAHAQFNLALIFQEGKYITADPGAAFYWFRRAAEQGNARAQCSLGLCYLEGTGTDKDDEKGINWLQEAAKNGDAEAIRLLRR
jgi:uncharacterized protein